MNDQYVYIGKYYHINKKEVPLDLKFGVTNNLENREGQLSSTKSPIKYMILKAWKLPKNTKREKVEELISVIFDSKKYDGCEWYNLEDNEDVSYFQNKIVKIFEILSAIFTEDHINFEKVEFDNINDEQSKIESEIRQDNQIITKQYASKLKVVFDENNIFQCETAKTTFIKSIKYIIDKIGVENIKDYQNLSFLHDNIESMPTTHKLKNEPYKGIYIAYNYGNDEKINLIKKFCKLYEIDEPMIELI